MQCGAVQVQVSTISMGVVRFVTGLGVPVLQDPIALSQAGAVTHATGIVQSSMGQFVSEDVHVHSWSVVVVVTAPSVPVSQVPCVVPQTAGVAQDVVSAAQLKTSQSLSVEVQVQSC